MHVMQPIIHYFLHLVFPLPIALIFFRKSWLKSWFVFLATMLVDLDHLLATPIFDPSRCSVGFHPLHSYVAIVIYVLMLLHPKLKIIAIGLLMHVSTDVIDCLLMKFE